MIAEIGKILGGNVHKVELASLTLNQQVDLSNSAEYIIGSVGQALRISIYSYNSKVVILDSFKSKLDRGGGTASLRDLAIHLGHQAIILKAQTSLKNNGNWVFPLDSFTEQFTKAVRSIKKFYRKEKFCSTFFQIYDRNLRY